MSLTFIYNKTADVAIPDGKVESSVRKWFDDYITDSQSIPNYDTNIVISQDIIVLCIRALLKHEYPNLISNVFINFIENDEIVYIGKNGAISNYDYLSDVFQEQCLKLI